MSPTSHGTQNNKRHITYLDNTPNTYSMTSNTMEGIRVIQYAQIIILPFDTAAIGYCLPIKTISIKHGRKRSNTTHTHKNVPNGWHNTYKRVGRESKWENVIRQISMEKTRAQSACPRRWARNQEWLPGVSPWQRILG